MKNKHDISIIILNWNDWIDTIECLESIYQSKYYNYNVIIVDNASSDDSIEKIKRYAMGEISVESPFFEYTSKNKPITVFEVEEDMARKGFFDLKSYKEHEPYRRMVIIKNKDNYGYTGGNNVGIMFALKVFNSDYIYILNNDVVVPPNNLGSMVKSFEVKKDAGIVGCIHKYYAVPRKIAHICGRIDFKKAKTTVCQSINNKEHTDFKLLKVPLVGGAAFMIKKDVIKNIGLFNNCLFLYWDETEYILRAKKAGFNIYSNISTNIWHKISSSTKKISLIAFYLDTRNAMYIIKNYGTYKEKLILSLYLIAQLFRTLISSLIKYRSLFRFWVYCVAVFRGLLLRICDDDFLYFLRTKNNPKKNNV